MPNAADRRDLAVFAERARRLDPAAVIRFRRRDDDRLVAWVATGFDVLAARVFGGRCRPADLCAAADAVSAGLPGAGDDGFIETGFSMDSAWRGALPPEHGFAHLDDVPVAVFADLAQRGAEVAREQGAAGPPTSLLDQDVLSLSASSAESAEEVGVPMRCVFALTGMGFLPPGSMSEERARKRPGASAAPPVGDGEVVRVRATRTWLRIDARFGSVYRRRGGPLLAM
ncbi:hypothetical protein L2Z93_002547 [Mycolicibacterium brumae]|uniref:hypothetical protein n=1 Tax=Mycolicibacterium brumae TaxID=85968 RepID=UPI0021AF4364|nr:hypothetical protein [Mycolicibacterium brumae]UWW09447.1 hypothetical protein L2Z93_002547 [Mycolicibacterium brumae]